MSAVEAPMATNFWCHLCSRMVNPTMEVEIKCPLCQSGFVEEMSSDSLREFQDSVPDFGNDRQSLSLWAPILMGMMSNPHRRRRNRRFESGEDNDLGYDNNAENENGEGRNRRVIDLDGELEEMLSRRRRRSAAIVQLLRGPQAGLAFESDNNETSRDDADGDTERERVILINPYNQTIMVQGSFDLNPHQIGSLGDYFTGRGLDALLQHLAENDPNRYGTPPAQKEVVEALPTVKISESSQCSVCLDDFEIGSEARQMPCKHEFHHECLIPWLKLHSSCPVCRYQIPTDETKTDSESDRTNSGTSSASANSDHENNRERFQPEDEARNGGWFSLPWPFSGLFSSAQNDNNNNSSN